MCAKTNVCAHSVDFPAPLAPTTAIRDSKPMSKSMSFRISLSGEYPKVIFDACKRGGDNLSVSGNLFEESSQLVCYECAVDATDLKVSVSSISGGVNSGS